MYELSTELEELGRKVIEKYDEFEELRDEDCRIIYLKTNKQRFSNMKKVYADTEKISDKIKTVLSADFIITFYPASEYLDEKRMEILMRHELKHVGFRNGKCSLIPHDIEDFRDIIEEYGINWPSDR